MFGFESQRLHYIPAYDDNIIMEKMYKLVHKKNHENVSTTCDWLVCNSFGIITANRLFWIDVWVTVTEVRNPDSMISASV